LGKESLKLIHFNLFKVLGKNVQIPGKRALKPYYLLPFLKLGTTLIIKRIIPKKLLP